MKIRSTFTLLLLSILANISCSQEPPAATVTETSTHTPQKSLSHVDAAGAAKLLESGDPNAPGVPVTVLDVRTPQEFAEGHIKGAVNVDFRAATFKEEAGKLDKTKPYLVHCRSGGRSTSSLEILNALNFEKLHHLDGGITAWSEAGNPVEK